MRMMDRPMEWILYDPSSIPVSFETGDTVYVRPTSATPGPIGRCVSPLPPVALTAALPEAAGGYDNYHVDLEVASTRTADSSHPGEEPPRRIRAKRKRLVPVYQLSHIAMRPHTHLTILLTPNTIHFRQLAAAQIVRHTDRVLEIGCSTGQTSAIVWRMQPASWMGWDTGADMVDTTTKAVKQLLGDSPTQCCCHQINALQDPQRARDLANQLGPISLVLIDIGGNRELNGVLGMMQWALTHLAGDSLSPLPLRMVIIKSEQLVRALRPRADPSGRIPHGTDWFHQWVRTREAAAIPSHPLQAPLRMSPLDANKSICRYHNYHANGCLKNKTNDCPHDHEHCHWCSEPGHVARACPQTSQESASS